MCLAYPAQRAALLWLLRPAEAAAASFLEMPPEAQDDASAMQPADSRIAMMHLAMRFLEIAYFLRCQVEVVFSNPGERDDRRDSRPFVGAVLHEFVRAIAVLDFVRPVAALDTS